MITRRSLAVIVAMLFSCASTIAQPAADKEKILALAIEISAPVDSVWSRWTTESGRKKFFAPSSRFDLTTLGYMEVLFMPQAAEGQRGAENNRVLAFQEKQMLSFTWDAPPQFPDIRALRTTVIIRFKKLDDRRTLVILRQMGWGTGGNWDAVYNYFSNAWGTFVLPNLKYSLETAPITWGNFPKDLKPATVLPE